MKKGQTFVWSFFSSFRSELFGERERNRNRRVTGLHLAEGPAANCILDFGIEFAETSRRRNSRDADDFATRSDRELQGNLTLESRFLLQALVIDVAKTRSTLADNLHDVCSGTRTTTGTHVDITHRRSLDGTLSLSSDTTATTAKETCKAVTDTTGTTFCVTFIEATISLTATATENGLTRSLETSDVLEHLIDVLGELLVLHQVISSSRGILGLSSEELEHAASLRSVRLTLTARLTPATSFLTRLLRFGLLLFFLLLNLLGCSKVHGISVVEYDFSNDLFVHGSPNTHSQSDPGR